MDNTVGNANLAVTENPELPSPQSSPDPRNGVSVYPDLFKKQYPLFTLVPQLRSIFVEMGLNRAAELGHFLKLSGYSDASASTLASDYLSMKGGKAELFPFKNAIGRRIAAHLGEKRVRAVLQSHINPAVAAALLRELDSAQASQDRLNQAQAQKTNGHDRAKAQATAAVIPVAEVGDEFLNAADAITAGEQETPASEAVVLPSKAQSPTPSEEKVPADPVVMEPPPAAGHFSKVYEALVARPAPSAPAPKAPRIEVKGGPNFFEGFCREAGAHPNPLQTNRAIDLTAELSEAGVSSGDDLIQRRLRGERALDVKKSTLDRLLALAKDLGINQLVHAGYFRPGITSLRDTSNSLDSSSAGDASYVNFDLAAAKRAGDQVSRSRPQARLSPRNFGEIDLNRLSQAEIRNLQHLLERMVERSNSVREAVANRLAGGTIDTRHFGSVSLTTLLRPGYGQTERAHPISPELLLLMGVLRNGPSGYGFSQQFLDRFSEVFDRHGNGRSTALDKRQSKGFEILAKT